MQLVNIDYIPGKEFEALGIAKGTVVYSRNFGKDFMAGMKTLVGGEIEGYTEMLNTARQIAVKRNPFFIRQTTTNFIKQVFNLVGNLFSHFFTFIC